MEAGSAIATASPSATPIAAIALLAALAATAGGLWWRRRQGTSASGQLLVIKEAVSVGPRRSLLVVDVAGRRVLLSSSEAGLGLLLDCGPTPVAAVGTDPERFFTEALASAMKSDTPTSLSLVGPTANGPTLPQPLSASSGPLLSQAAFRGDVEATEIVRRLQGGRNL
jgi:flagellar biogenesis protein FliO